MDKRVVEMAKKLKREAHREWQRANKDKVKKNQQDYWNRKAVEALKNQQDQEPDQE